MNTELDLYLNKRFVESVKKIMKVDIDLNTRINVKTGEKSLVLDKDSFLVYFSFPFDDDLLSALGLQSNSLPYNGISSLKPDGAVVQEIIIITYKDIEEFISTIKNSNVKASLIRWSSEEEREAYEEERKRKAAEKLESIKNCELTRLDRESTFKEFLHLLYMLDYSPEDRALCVSAYKKDYGADMFPEGSLFIKDNRAYYYYDEEHILIVSKNLYDAFWASQGNGFESCFSLTSAYKYITAFPYLMAKGGVYLSYITKTGDITKWSCWIGHKAKLPSIVRRAWTYKSGNDFIAGFVYGKDVNKGIKRPQFKDASEVSGRPFIDDLDTEDALKYLAYYDNLYLGDGRARFTVKGDYNHGRNDAEHSLAEGISYKSFMDLYITFDPDIKELSGEIAVCNKSFVEIDVLPRTGLINNSINKILEKTIPEDMLDFSSVRLVVNGSSDNLPATRRRLRSKNRRVAIKVFLNFAGYQPTMTIKGTKNNGETWETFYEKPFEIV